jgi:hypothetical protein
MSSDAAIVSRTTSATRPAAIQAAIFNARRRGLEGEALPTVRSAGSFMSGVTRRR